MKKLIFILFLFVGVKMTSSQVYIDGENVISLSTIANSSILSNNKRISTIEAFNQLKNLKQETAIMVYGGPEGIPGEHWFIDGMLVTLVTRQITSNSPKDNLLDKEKSVGPNLHVSDKNGDSHTYIKKKQWFSEVKSINNFEVLVYYYKKVNTYKSFQIQDNKGKYKILGIIRVREQDAEKAHALIDKILNDLRFK